MTYSRTVGKGTYAFGPDTFDTGDFTEFPDPSVNEAEFTTVATMSLSSGEGAALGRGNTANPDRAEGFIYFDAQSDSAAALSGRVKFVVLNTNNTPVDTLWRGRLGELRTGQADSDRRNRKPFPYQTPAQMPEGEIYGDDYSIGIQIELDDGTDTFSLSDSSWKMEGYYGEKVS